MMVAGRLVVLPTSWRVAGRRFFEPDGRPGPGRLGFGARAGQGKLGRRFLNPRRTRAGVSRPGSAGFSHGRRRSATRGRAGRSWVCAAMISQVHRSAAAGVRSFGRVQPRVCLIVAAGQTVDLQTDQRALPPDIVMRQSHSPTAFVLVSASLVGAQDQTEAEFTSPESSYERLRSGHRSKRSCLAWPADRARCAGLLQ